MVKKKIMQKRGNILIQMRHNKARENNKSMVSIGQGMLTLMKDSSNKPNRMQTILNNNRDVSSKTAVQSPARKTAINI